MALKAANNNNHSLLSIFSFLALLLTGLSYCQTDRLLQGQVLKDGEELVSAFGNFRLGFFSPDGCTREGRYLAIYYKRAKDRYVSRYISIVSSCRLTFPPGALYYASKPQPQPVWVANRNTPVLYNESASLTIDRADANLKILRRGGASIAVSRVQTTGNTSAVLLKSGNLVLYEMNSDGSVRKALWQSFDYRSDTLLPGMKLGINLQTGQQWFLRSWSCESPEESSYILGMDPNVTNKLVIWKGKEVSRTGGIWLNDSLHFNFLGIDDIYNFSYTSNERERYLTYSVIGDVTSFPMLTIDSAGGLTDDRGVDISCHFFEGCKVDQITYLENYYNHGMKWWFRLIIAVAVALGVCLMLYLGYRIRRKYFKAEDESRRMSLVIVVGVAFLLLKKLKAKVESMVNRQKLLRELGHNVSLPTIFGNRKAQANKDQTMKRDLKIFDFQTIAAATDNFSTANRLGQGGFGPVYKGELLDGQEIAIKRLSKSSGQGLVEFKNEAKLIAKLQHTNLVRLFGCSLQGGERLLVYEYMPNKSLKFLHLRFK